MVCYSCTKWQLTSFKYSLFYKFQILPVWLGNLMSIEVMLYGSLCNVSILLCHHKVVLMTILSTAKQVLWATWESVPPCSLPLPCLLLAAFVLHSLLHSPKVLQRFLRKEPFQFHLKLFSPRSQTQVHGGPSRRPVYEADVNGLSNSLPSSSAKTLLLEIHNHPAHPCYALTCVPQEDVLKP